MSRFRRISLIGAGLVCVLAVSWPVMAAEDGAGDKQESKKRDARAEWWWDEAWWSEGALSKPATHPVETRNLSYRVGDVEVPVLLARPKGGKRLNRGHWDYIPSSNWSAGW